MKKISNLKQKKVALYPQHTKWHSVYNPTIELLSKNYTLIYHPQSGVVKESFFSKISRNPTVRLLYLKLIRPVISFEELKLFFKPKMEFLEHSDVIFSSNTIPPGEDPFILDLENVTALGGYDYRRLNKEKIEKQLSDKRCKAIICWNEISKKSLIETINSDKFKHKLFVLPFSIKSSTIKKQYSKKKVNLLFVSSVNNIYDFELKGGIIALEAYKQLVEKYQNVSFYVRAKVPKKIKKIYGGLRGLHFIEEFLPEKQMRTLFLNSDILFEPVPGINLLLDCMNYGLPSVCFNFWMIPEMCLDRKNGLIVDARKMLGDPQYIEDYLCHLSLRWMKLYSHTIDKDILDEFILKTSQLIEDPALREKMGKQAKKMVSDNEIYSLRKRNEKIKQIFNDSLRS
ncbi:MAG TPA: hypothetical protein VJK51_01940 [Candidatus Nanoarchaeia archaeon]|nr:hypothetical protein [Candidatus Nanoarchaeia archaeon]